jgi:hypothetical protein
LMKTLLTIVAIAALATTAFAGGNPGVEMYISFDQSGAGAEVFSGSVTDPGFYNAYVCMTNITQGVTAVRFRMTDLVNVYPGTFIFANFTPAAGVLSIGDYFTDLSLASTTCLEGPVAVWGYLQMYVGNVDTQVCLEILDAPVEARSVVDCTPDTPGIDLYCVLSNGSLDGGECPAGDCPPPQPVEDSTWGGIKALYQ